MKRNPLWLLERANDIAAKFEQFQGVIVLSGATLLITVGVVARYFLESPIPWVLQVSAWLVIFLGILMAAFGQREGSQVSIDVITSRMRASRQAAIALLGNILSLVVIIFLSTIVYGTMAYSLAVDEKAMGFIRPPIAPLKFAILLGFCLVGLVFFTNIFKSIGNLREARKQKPGIVRRDEGEVSGISDVL